MPHAVSFRNAILKNLAAESIARLRLRPVTLEVRHPMETPGQPIRNIYFLETGVVSVTTQFSDGSEVETGMFGCESLSGVSAFLGARESLNTAYIQIAGHGFVASVRDAAAEFQRGGPFQAFALRAIQAQLLQSRQNAGCNATHEVEQRLARWLLVCSDRMGSSLLTLSHEFMADMLGSRRSTITVAAGRFKDRGLIEYTRGSVRILDHVGLESAACECYRSLRDHLNELNHYDSGPGSPSA